MKYRQSLRNRILISFCVLGLILAATYWALIDLSMHLAENMVLENRLQSEIDGYIARLQTDPGAIPPYSRYIKGYTSLTDMPAHLGKMVENLPEGFYESDESNVINDPVNYCIAIKKIPDLNKVLYLVYDVGTQKINEKHELIVHTILFFITVIVAVISALIGWLIARKISAPVVELADRVARSSPDNLPVNLSQGFADDEIGFLAKNLEQSMRRIQAFIKREKEFTRDASHELRTPVTVIKGAVELIVQLPVYQEESLVKPIKRIERSVKGMSLTIDTFLWLAREGFKTDIGQTCDVVTETREAFVEYKELFRWKAIEAEMVENAAPMINAPAAVFRIAINNLLRNAFYHTPQGKIRLTVESDRIELLNKRIFDIDDKVKSVIKHHVDGENGKGFGFGLVIVNRLCERFGWRLEITERCDNGMLVVIFFS